MNGTEILIDPMQYTFTDIHQAHRLKIHFTTEQLPPSFTVPTSGFSHHTVFLQELGPESLHFSLRPQQLIEDLFSTSIPPDTLLVSPHPQPANKFSSTMALQISGTMYVPPELQTLICQNMTKTELKCARLVCRSFDRAAVPFLFDEVFVAANYSILDTADLVASRFGLYIRTIHLSIIDYNFFSKKTFVTNVERRMGRTLERLTFEKFYAHVDHAFDLYNKARTEDLEITDSGELLARLCLTLSKLPKIRKFIASNYDSGVLCGLGDLLHPNFPWKREILCPFKDCNLSASDHIGFLHHSDPPNSIRREPLHPAMLAISLAKPTITELAILYHREDAIKYEDSLFLTARQSARLESQFQSLKRLRLGLGKSPGENSYYGSTIAKALSVAVNLESFSIDGDFPFSTTSREFRASTMMSSLLRRCQFPKLKSLKLRFVNSRDDEFLDFLENSPGLIHLKLDNFYLESGLWERVLEVICSTFPLESIRLQKVRAWISDKKEYEIYYEDPVLLSRPPIER